MYFFVFMCVFFGFKNWNFKKPNIESIFQILYYTTSKNNQIEIFLFTKQTVIIQPFNNLVYFLFLTKFWIMKKINKYIIKKRVNWNMHNFFFKYNKNWLKLSYTTLHLISIISLTLYFSSSFHLLQTNIFMKIFNHRWKIQILSLEKPTKLSFIKI